MSTASRESREITRMIESELLNRLAEVGQRHVAESIGIDESAVSKWKGDGRIAQIAQFIEACGLKVVPVDAQVARACDLVVEPSELEALKTLALKYLRTDEARP